MCINLIVFVYYVFQMLLIHGHIIYYCTSKKYYGATGAEFNFFRN